MNQGWGLFIRTQVKLEVDLARHRLKEREREREMNNAGGQYPDFPAVQTHGGQFISYDIFGSLFEVTSKYRPPIVPIGRGAYGIVWYVR